MKSIYHAIFEPHSYYPSLVWAQNSNSIKRLFVSQTKSLRIIYFLNHNARLSPLFRDLSILKLSDKIALGHCLFINKYFDKCLTTIFKNWFTLSSEPHTYNTPRPNLGCNVVPRHKTRANPLVLALLYRNCSLIFKQICTFSKHSVLFSVLLYRCFITFLSTRTFDCNFETFCSWKFISCILKSEYIFLISIILISE